MNRTYEIMFIVRPDIEEAEIDKIIETFSGYITAGGGAIKNSLADQKMGRRRLAYTVRKFNDGFYILLVVDAPASLIHEIERRLRVSEQVIKFITVRTDEEDKRVAKIKKHRDAHVKRSALPQPGAQASPEAASRAPEATEAAAPAESIQSAAETAAPEAEAAPAQA
jgi:small subunit ribosomal protein S6